ncbi:hypothetical protein GGX14DRAFT_388091 [Mycena pura]|uniref:Uncharacterized protein n=1 Tax=Mycena pura TaxID=153505 RepID=A0AAD6VTF7_9AGAR|nr:hypothetical protein GGX14DRAFT_388091 [Mycena pura]
MSLFVQGLRALRKQLPRTLPFKNAEFGDLTTRWLEELSGYDPAARQLWTQIKASFESGRVIAPHSNGKAGHFKLSESPFNGALDKFGEESIFDAFHAFALFQQILEKRYERDPKFLPSTFPGATPSPTDETQRSWSLISQHTLKMVGGGVMSRLLATKYSMTYHAPATIQVSFVPHIQRAWELGYSLPGRKEEKAELQKTLKAELIRIYPALEGWKEPLMGLGLLVGHCGETCPWLRMLWVLHNGGTAWAMAAATKSLVRVWEDLIMHENEHDFLLNFVKEIPNTAGKRSKPETASSHFCRNCRGAAKRINMALGCSIVDLVPLLGKAELRCLLIGYTAEVRGVLLGSPEISQLTADAGSISTPTLTPAKYQFTQFLYSARSTTAGGISEVKMQRSRCENSAREASSCNRAPARRDGENSRNAGRKQRGTVVEHRASIQPGVVVLLECDTTRRDKGIHGMDGEGDPIKASMGGSEQKACGEVGHL